MFDIRYIDFYFTMTKVIIVSSRLHPLRYNVTAFILFIQLTWYCSKLHHCHGLLVLPGWNDAFLYPTSSLDHSILLNRIQDDNAPTVTKVLKRGKDYHPTDKLLSPLLSWTKVSSFMTISSMSYVSSSSNIITSADIVDSTELVESSTSTNQEKGRNDSFDENVDNQLSLLKSMRGGVVLQTDEVVRVVDGNTVQLANNGFVTLAAVQSPSFYSNSNNKECMSVYPSTKLKQLLPPRRKVQFIKLVEENNKKRSLVFTKKISKSNEETSILVNAELIRSGMGKPTIRGQSQAEKLLPGITNYFEYLHEEAKQQKVGMYQPCELDVSLSSSTKNTNEDKEYDFDNQFQPMELAVETQWGDDGGKQILKNNQRKNDNEPLSNPGDTKQCYDFKTFEDALQWYERYLPLYGDVAQLDKDGDGIPCSGLPHTTNQERYRIKKKVTLNNN